MRLQKDKGQTFLSLRSPYWSGLSELLCPELPPKPLLSKGSVLVLEKSLLQASQSEQVVVESLPRVYENDHVGSESLHRVGLTRCDLGLGLLM